MSDKYEQNPYRSGPSDFELQNVNPSQPPSDMVAFFAEVDEVKRDLVQYDDNIERIEGLHKRDLAAPDLETHEFSAKQLDALSGETRALQESLKHRIKGLEAKSQRDSTKRSQADNMKRQFMQLIQKYQATEANFGQRYRDVAERQFRIVQPDATDAEAQQAIDDASGQQIFSQALLQSNRRGQAREALTEVQVRHREIQKISKTMEELAVLFQDMEILVAEQDEAITQVDNQAAAAQHDIEHGVGHQQRAIISAKKWRSKKVWCVIIVVIIIIILAAVLGGVLGTRHN